MSENYKNESNTIQYNIFTFLGMIYFCIVKWGITKQGDTETKAKNVNQF